MTYVWYDMHDIFCCITISHINNNVLHIACNTFAACLLYYMIHHDMLWYGMICNEMLRHVNTWNDTPRYACTFIYMFIWLYVFTNAHVCMYTHMHVHIMYTQTSECIKYICIYIFFWSDYYACLYIMHATQMYMSTLTTFRYKCNY